MSGKTFSNTAPFGAYPLQVQGYTNLHDSLEGSMAREEIETSDSDVNQQSGQEVSFHNIFTSISALFQVYKK